MRHLTTTLILLTLALLACNLSRLAAEPPGLPTPTALSAWPTATPGATSTATQTPESVPSPSPYPTPVISESVTRSDESRGPVTLTRYVTVRRYSLRAASADELATGMATYGPQGFWALTEPLFDWGYACECRDGACGTGPVEMILSLTYSFPGWDDPGGDPLLSLQWGNFVTALEAHERLHGDLAADCAWQLGESFVALPAQADCAGVDAAVRAASEAIFPGCRQAQRQLDDETGHGQTQGVAWPP